MRKVIGGGIAFMKQRLQYFEYILMALFVARPVIDLFWSQELILGMNLAGMIALLLVGITFLYVLCKPERLGDPLVWTGLIFAGLMFLATLFNASSYQDFDYFLRFCSGLSFLIILAPAIDEEKFHKCLLMFVLLTLIPILITFLQRAGLVSYTYFDYIQGVKIPRGSGGYRQPSVLTRFCVFGMLYVLYLLETKYATRKFKIFAACYAILNVIAVLLSYHRTGYLLFLLVAGLWYFWKYRKNLSKYVGKVILAGLGIAAVFAILYALGFFSIDLSVFKRMLSLENIVRIEDGKLELVLRGRGEFIKKLLLGFQKNPIFHTIFGNGTYFNAYTGIEMRIADMDFVRVLWNCGIVGFLAWLVHYGVLLKEVYRRRRHFGLEKPICLALCVFLCFVVWGLTLETTATPNIMYHFYLVCGYVCYRYKGKYQKS